MAKTMFLYVIIKYKETFIMQVIFLELHYVSINNIR